MNKVLYLIRLKSCIKYGLDYDKELSDFGIERITMQDLAISYSKRTQLAAIYFERHIGAYLHRVKYIKGMKP